MVLTLDIRAKQALEAIERGDTSKLADLFENGNLKNLPALLSDRPDLRKKIAKALRSGTSKGRGPRPKDNRTRDEHIYSAVAYWMGYGLPGWQEEFEPNSYFHAAKEDLARSGYYLEAGTIRNVFGKGENKPFALLGMTIAFLDGAEHGIQHAGDKNLFIREAFSRLEKLELMPFSYYELLKLHANSTK